IATALPPASATILAVSFTASALSAMTSRAPSLANSSALARPMPLAAPVMTAERPSRRPMKLPLLRCLTRLAILLPLREKVARDCTTDEGSLGPFRLRPARGSRCLRGKDHRPLIRPYGPPSPVRGEGTYVAYTSRPGALSG